MEIDSTNASESDSVHNENVYPHTSSDAAIIAADTSSSSVLKDSDILKLIRDHRNSYYRYAELNDILHLNGRGWTGFGSSLRTFTNLRVLYATDNCKFGYNINHCILTGIDYLDGLHFCTSLSHLYASFSHDEIRQVSRE